MNRKKYVRMCSSYDDTVWGNFEMFKLVLTPRGLHFPQKEQSEMFLKCM